MQGPAPLLIPVENQVRELDAKLLLAAVAAESGFPVLLGSRAFVHYAAHRVPRGVYLAKSMRRLSDRMFRILRDLGHEIVGFDEEALVHSPPAHYYERRLSERAVRQVSHLLAWGPENAELFRGFPACAGIPIHVTGNPRTDLLRPELRDYFAPEVERLRAAYGSFLLFNSSFGSVNAFVPAIQETGVAESRNAPGAFAMGRARHRRALLAHFERMVPDLADAFPEHTLVVRPHPSESHESWRALAQGRSNVRVVSEGSVIPWLLAARAMIHNGCTTGVEGALLGTPVVAYMPIVDEAFDDPLPNSMSHRVFHFSELVELLTGVLEGRVGPYRSDAMRKVVDHFFAGLEGPLASERITQVLVEAGYRDAAPPAPRPGARARGWLHNAGRTAVKRINRMRPGHRGSAAYHDHRFPPVGADALERRIGRMGTLLGRFEGVQVREHSPNVFAITAASAASAASGTGEGGSGRRPQQPAGTATGGGGS